uniref:Retrovirus-related Pol polyprotein from transposon TNT 1-94 n=1 Tax=Zeugodacus cucurbitae TaxID=28588 RepID=A0A0A1WIR6_ZEUCU
MLLALGCEYKLYLHQMDVSTAYLNSDLHEVVYMKQPEGFVDKKFPQRVLKLNKALYGLKQSGREWNMKLDEVLKSFGFTPCISDPCVYTRNVHGNYIIIMVYVDDLIIGCSKLDEVVKIREQISSIFDVVDGGPLKYFLGLEIERKGETGAITICQKKYISDLLCQYKMLDCKAAVTPLVPGFQVNCNSPDCRRVNTTNYQSLIGSLMYLAVLTRPDILHSVCKLSQQNIESHSEHETGAKHILRYLKGTIDLKLHYKWTGKAVKCYVDADWGSDASDRKSYTGSAFIAAGSVFSWKSKKQSVVALSSTEAEYIALSTAAKEAAYIRKLLTEMGFLVNGPTVINSDNQGAMHLVKHPVYHSRSKHIDLKYHHVRDMYKNNEINLNYICTEEMFSDIFTKNLQKTRHCKFRNNMGLY